MEKKDKHPVNTSRRNFISLEWAKKQKGGVSESGSSEETQKMLMADGTLVKVKVSALSMEKSKQKASNKEILQWMKNHPGNIDKT